MVITGTETNDVLPDTSGDDAITAGAGHDTVTLTGGADTADGGAGDDSLTVDYSAATTDVIMTAPALTGPVIGGYPAPGGTSFSGSGIAGNTGGRTGTYTNFDTTQYDSLWWGPNNVHAFIQATGDGEMALQSISEDGLTATWSGTASVTSLNYTGPVYIRFVVTILAGSSGWVMGTDPDGPDAIALINADTFQVNQQFVAATTPDGTYLPLNEWFNTLNAGGVGEPLQTAFTGQFIYDDGGSSGSIDDGSGNSVDYSDFESFNITSGLGNDTLFGASGNDVLRSDAGNDSLDGGNGDDWLEAGAGDDTIVGGEGDDTVSYENATGGVQVNLALGSGSGGDGTDTLSGVENAVGTAFADVLVGNSATNSLQGGAGNDTIEGGAGDDLLDGGADVDTVRYSSALGAVVVNLQLGTASGDGSDTLVAFENVIGSGFADTLTGSESDNVINGGAGADTMTGDLGNDLYVVDNAGDVVVELSGQGTDEVRSSITYTLTSNVENLTLTGSANIDAIGNALDNLIIGNGGNNILNGGGGADIMRGGAGDDVYVANNVADRAIENDNSGNDTVRASVDFRLANYIETLILTGSEAIEGIGNGQANTIIGNNAANYIHGAGGADIMRGAGGDDTYVVENAGDQVFENANSGHDTVRSSVSFTLGANIEDLILTGGGAISGAGNALDNYMLGNDAANVMGGRDGADTIIGGGGNDRLLGDAGNDNLNAGSGDDWVEGGAGLDSVSGGTGADLFVFFDGDFGGATPATADRIRDFSHSEGDRVRLNFVDANTLAEGDQAFAFIGTGAFTHAAGQLRYEQIGGTTFVFGDTDGDGTADFAIRVDGLHDFTGGDFIL